MSNPHVETPPAKRLLLFGDPHGLPALLAAVPAERVVGLVGAAIRPHQHDDLRRLARQQGLPLLIQPRPSDPAYAAFLGAVLDLTPDLFLVYSYAMRLRSELLAIPAAGGVNVHGALLPQYRGASPLPHALLNMEPETGATMHWMTPEFDDGPIIAQCRVPIFFEDTWCEVYARIGAATLPMLRRELPRVLAGGPLPEPQDPSLVGYYRRRYPEDGAIDWDASVLTLYNLIRALVAPYPGAFYEGPEGRVVLDAYLTLPEVAALKFGPAGGRRLEGGRVRLVPELPVTSPVQPAPRRPGQADRPFDWARRHQLQAANGAVRFAVVDRATGERRGTAELANLDYGHRTGRLAVEPALAPDALAEVLTLVQRFGFEELELDRLVVRIGAQDTAVEVAIAQASFKWGPSIPTGRLAVLERPLPREGACANSPSPLT